jgi:hypothetical protein
MNSLNPLIKRACLIFATLFFISLPIVWISLFFNTYHGDLTRVGKWTDHDFTWSIEQKPIDPSLQRSPDIKDADVLVIGDSFSASLYWQSVLIKDNLKVTSLTWSQIGNLLCQDFEVTLKEQGFKGKHIIIESVERVAKRQFEKSVNCQSSKTFPKQTANHNAGPHPIVGQADFIMNWNGQFIAGLQTILNSAGIRIHSDYTYLYNLLSKNVRIYEIKDGCRYFSNRLCQYGLFFKEDYQQAGLNDKVLEDIKTLKNRLTNYQTTWVVIPNKSSIYHREELFESSADFWAKLSKENLGPDLFKATQEAKLNIKDIYAPNNTHYGSSGYLFVGEQIASYLKLNRPHL